MSRATQRASSGVRARPSLVSLAALALAACSKPAPPPDGRLPALSTVPAASARGAAAYTSPAAPFAPDAGAVSPALDANPLKLSPRRVVLDSGKRVFTFSLPMLQSLRLGSTLVLYAATVTGMEGEDFVVEGHAGPSYKVHPGYVIPVPDAARLTPGDPVLTEWNGVMKHGVVTKFVKERIGVRYTDMEMRAPEAFLLPGRPSPAIGASKAARFVKQTEGLVPGNYAAARDGAAFRHVLLVSPTVASDGRKQWFVLGFGGAAMLVDEPDLKPIPLRWEPKVGSAVWAESVGVMRKATVQSIDEAGLFTVKFERAGRPVTLGLGLLMAPIEGELGGSTSAGGGG